jgi:hypothetical protein
MRIEHLTPDCTGQWEHGRSDGLGSWRCRACAMEYPDTPLARIAAVRENLLGILLRMLEAHGRLSIGDRD